MINYSIVSYDASYRLSWIYKWNERFKWSIISFNWRLLEKMLRSSLLSGSNWRFVYATKQYVRYVRFSLFIWCFAEKEFETVSALRSTPVIVCSSEASLKKKKQLEAISIWSIIVNWFIWTDEAECQLWRSWRYPLLSLPPLTGNWYLVWYHLAILARELRSERSCLQILFANWEIWKESCFLSLLSTI